MNAVNFIENRGRRIECTIWIPKLLICEIMNIFYRRKYETCFLSIDHHKEGDSNFAWLGDTILERALVCWQ